MLLNVHSCFSYNYGVLSIEELVKACAAAGHQTIALTDRLSTSGVVDFLKAMHTKQLNAWIGVEVANGYQHLYTLIAQSAKGYQNINDFVASYTHYDTPFPLHCPIIEEVYVIYPLSTAQQLVLAPNEYIGIRQSDLSKLPLLKNCPKDKMLWAQPVIYTDKKGYNTHRLLRAIEGNLLLSQLTEKQGPIQEAPLLSPEAIQTLLADYTFIWKNTQRFCSQQFHYFELTGWKNKRLFTGDAYQDVELLRKLSYEGLAYRYGAQVPLKVQQRLLQELDVIVELNYTTYFLINWDLVQYALHKGYYHVGRGSGANSLVAYLLRITDVDPVDLDLYFERFINPYRSSPPDFDIDFSWTDRLDVTQYLFKKHGYQHTALLGAYNSFQFNSAIREVGKVFGLPATDIDNLQAEPALQLLGQLEKSVLTYAMALKDLPNHLTIHASGIVISDASIHQYTGTMMPPKGLPTTHFSMLEAEDIGLQKFDVLGQRGIAKIKDAIQLIQTNRHQTVDLHNRQLYFNDPKVKALLKAGDAIGCFYIESPAMRMLLTKLRADDYIRLVAASSIIRPGVSKSGMMREYILRFQNKERREKARQEMPELYALLEETYGVMVYQEDVLKVAHYFGGLTLNEADVLRKGMNFKYRNKQEFITVKDKFFSNCQQAGKPMALVEKVWNQIESFANFAFAKGHSASFAVESMQALYLKAYYPIEYMVATLNNGGGFYSTELYFIEAQRLGAVIEMPHINYSGRAHILQQQTIYIGFQQLANLEVASIDTIIKHRARVRAFSSLWHFMNEVDIAIEQLVILIRIGAFRFDPLPIKAQLWHARRFYQKKVQTVSHGFPLFETPPDQLAKDALPVFWEHPLEAAYTQIELLGFTLEHPFKLLKTPPPRRYLAAHLPFNVNKKVDMILYLIHRKWARTAQGEGMYFGTWLDAKGEWVDTVHFPVSLKTAPFKGPGCYHVYGVVMEEFGFVCIQVSTMKRLETLNLDDLAKEQTKNDTI